MIPFGHLATERVQPLPTQTIPQPTQVILKPTKEAAMLRAPLANPFTFPFCPCLLAKQIVPTDNMSPC